MQGNQATFERALSPNDKVADFTERTHPITDSAEEPPRYFDFDHGKE